VKYDITALETREIEVPEHVKEWIQKVLDNEENLSGFYQLDSFWEFNSDHYSFPDIRPFMYTTEALASLAEDLCEDGSPLAPDASVVEWLEDHEGFILFREP